MSDKLQPTPDMSNLMKFDRDLKMRLGEKDSVDNLLTNPWIFVRGVCEKIRAIDPERVSEIVMKVAAPKDSRERTKAINIRDLTPAEIDVIEEQIRESLSGSEDLILSITKTESGIRVLLKPEIGYLSDSLIQSPWQFVRAIAEMAGFEDEDVSRIAMSTVAPEDSRGLTQRITISGITSEEAEQLQAVIDDIIDDLHARDIQFDFDVSKDGRDAEIVISNIEAEPEIFFVSQGSHAISNSEVQTSGLDTCTAVGVRFSDGSNFLTHIDANTNTAGMKNDIRSLTDAGAEVEDYRVWVGSGMIGGTGADLSKAKAVNLLYELGLADQSRFGMVTFNNSVGISKMGQFYTR